MEILLEVGSQALMAILGSEHHIQPQNCGDVRIITIPTCAAPNCIRLLRPYENHPTRHGIRESKWATVVGGPACPVGWGVPLDSVRACSPSTSAGCCAKRVDQREGHLPAVPLSSTSDTLTIRRTQTFRPSFSPFLTCFCFTQLDSPIIIY